MKALYPQMEHMSRSKAIKVRVTEQELERLQAEANRRGVSMSEVIRDCIKCLPQPEAKKDKD